MEIKAAQTTSVLTLQSAGNEMKGSVDWRWLASLSCLRLTRLLQQVKHRPDLLLLRLIQSNVSWARFLIHAHLLQLTERHRHILAHRPRWFHNSNTVASVLPHSEGHGWLLGPAWALWFAGAERIWWMLGELTAAGNDLAVAPGLRLGNNTTPDAYTI